MTDNVVNLNGVTLGFGDPLRDAIGQAILHAQRIGDFESAGVLTGAFAMCRTVRPATIRSALAALAPRDDLLAQRVRRIEAMLDPAAPMFTGDGRPGVGDGGEL